MNVLVERRIERLSLNEILLLRAAAIQGMDFEAGIIEGQFFAVERKNAGYPGQPVEKAWADSHWGSGRYTFSHHQVHQAILRGMPPDDVEKEHRKVAKLLLDSASKTEIQSRIICWLTISRWAGTIRPPPIIIFRRDVARWRSSNTTLLWII